ncbi:unnamed protein product [Vitrella brassicaformis CCMP3155]|uniref:Uncharacterized protein n=1 Tax=Vitrella brassicaformis (strain CCMP3155) TaxID=1169540 RepID=A0A0G4EL94_VITBC|nr:unnamed protein product [Vitrella brassicaformis CCMP3155]|eukprot:CEL97722.1 unnamed protein product [Vitrella brassicaformis CCMP3155]
MTAPILDLPGMVGALMPVHPDFDYDSTSGGTSTNTNTQGATQGTEAANQPSQPPHPTPPAEEANHLPTHNTQPPKNRPSPTANTVQARQLVCPTPKDAFTAYVKKAAFERSLSSVGRHESPQQHYERSVSAEKGRLIIEAGLSRESFDSMVLLGAYALWEREKTEGRSQQSSEHYYYAALAAEREALALSYIKKIQLSRVSTSGRCVCLWVKVVDGP